MFSSLAIAFFCFIFPRWKKDEYTKKPWPTWSEEDDKIKFTLQVCVIWHFQSLGFVFHFGESCSLCSSWQINLWFRTVYLLYIWFLVLCCFFLFVGNIFLKFILFTSSWKVISIYYHANKKEKVKSGCRLSWKR